MEDRGEVDPAGKVNELANKVCQLSLQLKSRRREIDLWRKLLALEREEEDLEAQLHSHHQQQQLLRQQLQQYGEA